MFAARTNETNTIVKAMSELAEYGLPPRGVTSLFDVGTGEYLQYFELEILDQFVSKGGATCRFFEGSYGSGKTHLLRLLEELALKEGCAVAWIDLSQSLRLDELNVVVKHILQNIEIQIDGQRVRSLPNILSALRRKDQETRANRLKRGKVPHRGFLNAMNWAFRWGELDEEARRLIQDFLCGEKVRVGDLKRHRIHGIRGPLSRLNAERVLRTVINGLYSFGVRGTILLFDENEKTLQSMRSGSSSRLSMVANFIRRLIDGCVYGDLVGTVVVFAVLKGFFEQVNDQVEALRQRLQIVQGGVQHPVWRWPVMPIEKVNSASSPNDFLRALAEMFEGKVRECGGRWQGLRQELLEAGQNVLQAHAGPEFKRVLVKRLAELSIRRL